MEEKEKMMKKLLIFMLVLGLASVSQATMVDWTGFTSTGAVEKEVGGLKYMEYAGAPGELITIDLVADLRSTAFSIGAVAEALAVNADGQATVVTDMGGLLAGTIGTNTAMTAPTGVQSAPGWVDNWDGLLFDVADWYGDVAGGDPYGPVISSFTYTIGSLETDYWVAPLASGTIYYYMEGASASATLSYGTLVVDTTPMGVEIVGLHIVPEPMTVLLLGLGGLFLRRRRKIGPSMKKRLQKMGRIGPSVLCVLLVLGLAPFANATLSWTLVDENGGSIELGDTVLITLSSDVTGDWDYGIYVTTPTAAVLQNPTKLSGAGNAYSVTSYGGYVGHDYHSGGGGQKAAGWSTVQFLSNTADTYTVNLYDYTTYGGSYSSPPTTGVVTADLTVVPEPATIALLGLGGLFLMRRRR